MPKCYAFFCSIHVCFSFAAWPGNTICCSVMAEAVLAVFPSHSEIGRTRCTMKKIIFVRLQSSFAIPSVSNLRLIFGMFAYIKQALRLCLLLAVQSCTQFPTFLFQRYFAPDFHQEFWLGSVHLSWDIGWPWDILLPRDNVTFFRARRLSVEPVGRLRHCQRVVCVLVDWFASEHVS